MRKLYSLRDDERFLDILDGPQLLELPELVMKQWEVAPENDVEVTVFSWIEDSPTFGPAPQVPGETRDRFYAFSDTECPVFSWQENLKLEEYWETGDALGCIRHSGTKLWSSRWTNEENLNAIEAFRRLASESERTIGESVPFSRIF